MNCSWQELRDLLKPLWIETTRAANWMMTACYTRDITRAPSGPEKMPPMPRLYLYPEARMLFPSLPSQTVCSLEQSIQRKYRALRYKIVWTRAISLPAFRYPVPVPIHNQSWRPENDEEGHPAVNLRLQDRRVLLRLKAGDRWRRQIALYHSLLADDAVPGELAILQQRRQDEPPKLMLKLVGWFPRPKARESSGSMEVRSDSERLLAASVNGRAWSYNGDQIRRWVAQHRRQLNRWAEDAKFENRPESTFSDRRRHAAERQSRRMHSLCHEIAAQLAGFAERQRVAAVRLDLADHSYCPEFPWFRLSGLLREKLDLRGIEVLTASATVVKETPEALAEGEADA